MPEGRRAKQTPRDAERHPKREERAPEEAAKA